MYVATFENRFGQVKELGKAETKEKTMEYIDDFLLSSHYEPPYWRFIGEPEGENGMMIDVGSHSEFFYLKEVKEDGTETV